MSLFESHPASWSSEQLLENCKVDRVRRSGPGGQHRNKVETGIVLIFRPTGTEAQASEKRSQSENLAHAIKRLKFKLAIDYRMSYAHTQNPGLSELWRSRTKQRKLTVNSGHSDYVMLLAELFDLLEHLNWDVITTSEQCDISQSQILKFIKQDPKAAQHFQQQRIARGLHPLK